MQTISKKIALCGVTCALGVIIMGLGGLIPIATFCSPMLCGLLSIPVLKKCGSRLTLVWYAALSILSVLISPDKEAAGVYVFLGWYPVVQPYLNRLKLPLRLTAKFLIFNGDIILLYSILLYIFPIYSLKQEFAGLGFAMLGTLLLLGNLCFFLFDRILSKAKL